MKERIEITVFNDRKVPTVQGFDDYLKRVSENFCPYIEPSARKDNTTYTVISSQTKDDEVAERLVFLSGYVFAETLRQQRAKKSSALLCENILFQFPQIEDSLGEKILGWPHWVLKTRYTKLGILFGKFWKKAVEESRDGRDLPIPPCHFISVRQSIPPKDPRFFERTDWLRKELESANDKGQNVFKDLKTFNGLFKQIDLFCDNPTSSKLEDIFYTSESGEFYAEVKKLAAEQLKKSKNQKTKVK